MPSQTPSQRNSRKPERGLRTGKKSGTFWEKNSYLIK